MDALLAFRTSMTCLEDSSDLMRCRDPQGRPVNRRLQKPGNAGQEPRGLNFIPLEPRAGSTPLS